MTDAIIAAVLAAAPDARLRSDGFMRWIEAKGEVLGGRKSTADRAWRSAFAFIREGYRPPAGPSRETLIEIARKHIYLTPHGGPDDLCGCIADDVLYAIQSATGEG